MQIDSTFSVVAPIDTVWETIMDFERVAGCVPGASILNKLSDDAYQVGMTVKLGPVNMQYKGLLNVIERNAAEHRAVLGGKAQETRGQGTAEATVTLQLTEETGGTTRGTVNADLKLSGKAAAMGKGVIGSVTEQMMALFASNLQAMITAPGAAGGTAPAERNSAGRRPEPRPAFRNRCPRRRPRRPRSPPRRPRHRRRNFPACRRAPFPQRPRRYPRPTRPRRQPGRPQPREGDRSGAAVQPGQGPGPRGGGGVRLLLGGPVFRVPAGPGDRKVEDRPCVTSWQP